MPIGEIRAIARNLMPQFIAEGMSSRAIISYLNVNFGSAYRRQTLLSDIREFAHLAKYQSQTNSLRKETPFPKSLMHEKELRRERKYLIQGVVTYRDLDTGETTEQFVQMYSNKYGNKYTWEDEFIENYGNFAYETARQAIAFDINNVQHNMGRPY